MDRVVVMSSRGEGSPQARCGAFSITDRRHSLSTVGGTTTYRHAAGGRQLCFLSTHPLRGGCAVQGFPNFRVHQSYLGRCLSTSAGQPPQSSSISGSGVRPEAWHF